MWAVTCAFGAFFSDAEPVGGAAAEWFDAQGPIDGGHHCSFGLSSGLSVSSFASATIDSRPSEVLTLSANLDLSEIDNFSRIPIPIAYRPCTRSWRRSCPSGAAIWTAPITMNTTKLPRQCRVDTMLLRIDVWPLWAPPSSH